MEHRCSPRIETDLHVLIYQYNKAVAIGRIKDATTFGFYIESDWSTRPLQQITLVVMDKHLQKLQKHKLEAIVMHKTSHGFGVELETLETEQVKELHNFLAKPVITKQIQNPEALHQQVVNG
jgi:hypothetical protein